MSKNTEVYNKLTEKIVSLLDKGQVAWQRPWARTAFEIPRNAVTGRAYSGGNFIVMALWTMTLGYSHPLYLTMNQIGEINERISKQVDLPRLAVATSATLPFYLIIHLLRRNAMRFVHVRKGEGGFPVVYFEALSWADPDGKIDPKTGDVLMHSRPFAKVFWVWNVQQLANLQPSDLPHYATAIQNQPEDNPFTPIATGESLINAYASHLAGGLSAMGERAYYRPSVDSVTLPVKERFSSEVAYYMTMFHEFIHSTGHDTRLARDLTGDKMTENYGREELVAEMGAVYLASLCGMTPTFENSAAYLAGWKKACSDDPQLIYWAALRAQEAVEYVLNTTGLTLDMQMETEEVAYAS